MKKHLLIPIAIALAICLFSLIGCGVNEQSGTPGFNDLTQDDKGANGTSAPSATVDNPASDTAFKEVSEAQGDFSIVTEDGTYTSNDNVFTLASSGTYSLSGSLSGQVVADAEGDITIELNGVTITCSSDSPIKILNADKVEISAKKDTENLIKDTRSEKQVDDEEQGAGAIYSKSDLKIKGNGVLVVEGGYNNGIHTTKDLTIKNISLKVTAVNNALKGNDSITIESGTVVAISTKGDGIKTEDTDVSSKGNQRGTITITDGSVSVYAAGDGIQASYDFISDGGSVAVYTGSYSSYTASGAVTTSYKGIKVGNELTINAGAITVYSYDDGLHADHGATLENGSTGAGNININGGTVTVSVYSPTSSTQGGGRMGPRSWANQQAVSGSDGLHADNTLTISGGTVNIDSAYEGLEASFIVIQGGNTSVFATDDGINAAKKITSSPSILVKGGYLFVTVPTNGDTDGIDSNGTYTQTGGVVVTCGPGSASGRMGGGAWALDTDRGVTLQGGTLIIFGGMENTPSTSGMTKTVCSSTTVSSGSHTVTINGESLSLTLKYATNGCVVYSDGGQATLQ